MSGHQIRCVFPFTYLEFFPNGDVFTCCPGWTKVGPVGNIKTQSIEEIWNGKKLRNIRKNLYEGTLHKVCNLNTCPIAISKNTVDIRKSPIPEEAFEQIIHKNSELKYPPLHIALCDSGKCNLRCIMCGLNDEFVKDDPHLTTRIFSEIPKLFPYLSRIKLSGNGDPLFRKETRLLLQNFDSVRFPNVKFTLLTNGLLLTSKMWSTIQDKNIDSISISVDAASESTYLKIRRNGHWEKLQENLKMVSGLRKENKIKQFGISMVVLKSNYREMIDFVKMGKSLGCDQISFQQAMGSTAKSENIFLFPDTKALLELRDILNDPIMSDPAVQSGALENYKNYEPVFIHNSFFTKIKLLTIPFCHSLVRKWKYSL